MTKLVNQITNFFTVFKDNAVYPAHNSTGATIAPEHRAEIVFQWGGTLDTSRVVLRETQLVFGVKKNLHSISMADMKLVAGWIDAFYTTGDYRRVLQDAQWQTLFQVQNRTIDYIEGLTPVTKLVQTLPCYSCGIVLPSAHITIDHSKPQAGGQSQAILKNLRNLGFNLTHAAGVGSVYNAYITNTFAPLPTKALGGGGPIDPDGKAARYTLTERGITFLSTILAATSFDRVAKLCLHSKFNLKPYCAKCNIKKTNTLTDLGWINE